MGWSGDIGEKLAEAAAQKVTELVEEIYLLCEQVGDEAELSEVCLTFKNGEHISYSRKGWEARKHDRKMAGKEVQTSRMNTQQQK